VAPTRRPTREIVISVGDLSVDVSDVLVAGLMFDVSFDEIDPREFGENVLARLVELGVPRSSIDSVVVNRGSVLVFVKSADASTAATIKSFAQDGSVVVDDSNGASTTASRYSGTSPGSSSDASSGSGGGGGGGGAGIVAGVAVVALVVVVVVVVLLVRKRRSTNKKSSSGPETANPVFESSTVTFGQKSSSFKNVDNYIETVDDHYATPDPVGSDTTRNGQTVASPLYETADAVPSADYREQYVPPNELRPTYDVATLDATAGHNQPPSDVYYSTADQPSASGFGFDEDTVEYDTAAPRAVENTVYGSPDDEVFVLDKLKRGVNLVSMKRGPRTDDPVESDAPVTITLEDQV
jgi:hypothetical protein